MPTMSDTADVRLERLARTADDLAADLRGHDPEALARRPDRSSWAPVEIICHLRDIDELFLLRLELIAVVDEPLIPAAGLGTRAFDMTPDGRPAAPDRWAEARQYLRNDATQALATFRARREALVAHLRALTPEQWQRGGTHSRRGRLTVADFVTDMLRHDEVHRDQLRRALIGEP